MRPHGARLGRRDQEAAENIKRLINLGGGNAGCGEMVRPFQNLLIFQKQRRIAHHDDPPSTNSPQDFCRRAARAAERSDHDICVDDDAQGSAVAKT
jgi:hypothetical protein